jgi:exosortase A-associated hydrolase 2
VSECFPDALFVPSRRGRILVTFNRPETKPRHSVLLVPPFGEEMNKSRAMLARLGRLLAAQGVATVLPDLHGTGDSEGEFRDADWETWRADLARTVAWSEDYLAPVRDLVAVRLGAALAADASQQGQLPQFSRTVLWQPVFDRGRFLTQLLRMRAAAALGNDTPRESADELRRQLMAGATLEIGGYEISAQLGRSLAQAQSMTTMPTNWGCVSWMEIVRDPAAQLAPSSRRLIDATVERGVAVDPWLSTGEPFWMATEIVLNEGLLARTVEALAE